MKDQQVKERDSSGVEYLNVREVARRLHISQRKAWELIYDPSDPIPHFRLGVKMVRVRDTDLEQWMAPKRVNSSKVDAIVEQVLGR